MTLPATTYVDAARAAAEIVGATDDLVALQGHAETDPVILRFVRYLWVRSELRVDESLYRFAARMGLSYKTVRVWARPPQKCRCGGVHELGADRCDRCARRLRSQTTRALLLEERDRFCVLFDRMPTSTDWQRGRRPGSDQWPAASTVSLHFGTWAAFREHPPSRPR